MNTVAASAIERSISHNEIVHIEANPASEEFLALSAASDDSVDTGGMIEFWGTDDDGNKWRVHVRTWPRD